jgi:hypothetical protein
VYSGVQAVAFAAMVLCEAAKIRVCEFSGADKQAISFHGRKAYQTNATRP